MDRTIQAMERLCVSNRIPVFGTGKSAALEVADPGYRPSDTLPSAKSVVCVGLPVPRGVFQAKERSHEVYWRAANIYYRMIDAVLLRLAQIIEEEGETAVPVFG
jgi:epoxyqueuosine reductase QueG